jgi:2-iminobutanoate/2-iminopropanoate deaminase
MMHEQKENSAMAVMREGYQPAGLMTRVIGGQKLYWHVLSVAGGRRMIYVSGQVPRDLDGNVVGKGDMAAQITQIYNLMETVLAMGGATLANVVNEVMYTTDLQALVAAAHVRTARYAKYAPPANTGVQVSALFLPDAMLEIQATAVLGD